MEMVQSNFMDIFMGSKVLTCAILYNSTSRSIVGGVENYRRGAETEFIQWFLKTISSFFLRNCFDFCPGKFVPLTHLEGLASADRGPTLKVILSMLLAFIFVLQYSSII